ncbi:uncharacterized protein LOC135463695 [Liolophura sinensis]|uniref:uncharacterized protein LOC135463695 n=1 Tax=Liolophura sinensis TaxID=3198878 RepID=UPI0031593506
MVRAWVMNESTEDQRLPRMTDPPQFLDVKQLNARTGCEYIYLDPKNYESELDKVKAERGYTYQDLCDIRRETLPNYDEKLKNFFTEHIHSDEEIRFCLEGSGYFDARDKEDKWIRIELTPGDLLILPAGIYHRFTLDQGNYIKVLRFFVGEPVWTPINRPADDHPARRTYVSGFLTKG